MRAVYNRIYGDKVIWGITIFLSLISVLLIYIATDDLAVRGGRPTWYFAAKHAFILGFGFGIIYLIHLVKHSYFSRVYSGVLPDGISLDTQSAGFISD